MDRKDLFGLMEFYLFNDIVKKRTSRNGNTYFFVKDNDPQGGDLLSFAYYTAQDKTLHLFPYWFTQNKKVKSIPTYRTDPRPETSESTSLLFGVTNFSRRCLDFTAAALKARWLRTTWLMKEY